MLQPMMSAGHWSVKPESSSAAGTLLVTWLASTAASSTRPVRAEEMKPRKASMPEMLPMKMKKAAKMPSSE